MKSNLAKMLFAALIVFAFACKKEQSFAEQNDSAETAAILEAATDIDTMAEEAIQVAAELTLSASDPVTTKPELALVLSNIDTSFMSSLDHDQIMERVFNKLDHDSDQMLSYEELQTSLNSYAFKIGTPDPSKLEKIGRFVFGDSTEKHAMKSIKPRLDALMKDKRIYSLRARKRMVAHSDLECRKFALSSLRLVGGKESGACNPTAYREVNGYMKPFPKPGSFHAAIQKSRSNPKMQSYLSKLQESTSSLKVKMDKICSEKLGDPELSERVTKMCEVRKLNISAPHFSGAGYLNTSSQASE